MFYLRLLKTTKLERTFSCTVLEQKRTYLPSSPRHPYEVKAEFNFATCRFDEVPRTVEIIAAGAIAKADWEG